MKWLRNGDPVIPTLSYPHLEPVWRQWRFARSHELHDANGGVISNDNWRETQESEIAATQIQPSDDQEPAILATLVPGGYTAVVRGANDTIGVAVVEAYNLQ